MRRSSAKAGWRGFQQRVREAIQRRYGSVYALEKAGVIPKPTIRGWLRKTQPRLPFTPALLTFARETNASLTHLLLGEGPPLRGQVAMPDDLETALRAHILAELARDAGTDEYQDAARAASSALLWVVERCREELQRIRRLRKELKEDFEDGRLR